MKVEIIPSKVSGRIMAPPSKSSMQRAIAASLLSEGYTKLFNPSESEDSLAALKMAQCLGAEIEKKEGHLVIKGGLKPVCQNLNCGESGLGVRMFSAIAALDSREFVFEGLGTILNRTMDMLVDGLRLLGVKVECHEGKLPLKIKGPIVGGKISLDGSVSSQFISGLLMALPLVACDSVLYIDSLKSKPYIDLTIDVLERFGIKVINNDYREFIIPGNQVYKAIDYYIEEDWSGIAFSAVAGAIGGKAIIDGVSGTSVQADRRIIEALKLSGADVSLENNSLVVEKAESLPFVFDITDCPDLAPPLVALASFCNGRSILKGSSRLLQKESNRAFTLSSEFSKLGVDIRQGNDTIEVMGRERIPGGIYSSHGDHRIAMALAITACRADGPLLITGAEAVNKSYPGFFEDIKALGFLVKTIN